MSGVNAKDKQLYDLLGVKPDADETAIKKAYRKMALKWHPDKWANASEKEKKIAEEKIKELNEAHEILSDPQKKEIYDHYGYDAAKGNGHAGHGHGHHMNEEMMQNIFEQMGGGGGFPFNPFGNQGKKEKEITMTNVFTDVRMTFEQVYTGTEVEFEVTRYLLKKNKQPKKQDLVCTVCKGKGVSIRLVQMGPGIMSQAQEKCTKCSDGMIFPDDFFEKKLQKFKQPIKKGIASGETIIVNDMGHSVPDCFKDKFPGQKHSNLVIRVLTETHCSVNNYNYFRNVDNQPANLKVDLTIEPHEAICGAYKSIPFVDGNQIIIQIPPGLAFKAVNNGKHIVVVPGKGLPFYKQKNSFGELFVEVNISNKHPLDKSKLDEIWKIYTGTSMLEHNEMITKNHEKEIADGLFVDQYVESNHFKTFQRSARESAKQNSNKRQQGSGMFDDEDEDENGFHHQHQAGCAQQ